MDLVRKISLLIAVTVILLHSTIPHIHHSDMGEEEHSISHHSAINILDYIALVLHNDLSTDDGYLVLEQQNLLDLSNFSLLSFTSITSSILEIISTDETIHSSDYILKHYPKHNLSFIGLRAPPTDIFS